MLKYISCRRDAKPMFCPASVSILLEWVVVLVRYSTKYFWVEYICTKKRNQAGFFSATLNTSFAEGCACCATMFQCRRAAWSSLRAPFLPQARLVMESYSASVATRGVIHSNTSRAFAHQQGGMGFRPLHKPQWFLINKKVKPWLFFFP